MRPSQTSESTVCVKCVFGSKEVRITCNENMKHLKGTQKWMYTLCYMIKGECHSIGHKSNQPHFMKLSWEGSAK